MAFSNSGKHQSENGKKLFMLAKSADSVHLLWEGFYLSLLRVITKNSSKIMVGLGINGLW